MGAAAMPRMIPTPPKVCQQCKAAYHRPPRVSIKNWEASKWCSVTCMVASKKVPQKSCERCGKTITTKYREGSSRRRYCSLRCANTGKPINPVTTRYRTTKLPDGRNRAVHRVRMEAHLGRELATEEHVHHRDENKLNNEMNNLEVKHCSDHAREHMMGNQHARK